MKVPVPVTIPLTELHHALASRMAKQCALGGVSRVRAGAARRESLEQDQLVGQLGQLAMSIYLYGHAQPYVLSRHVQNQHPHLGDNGIDLLGTNLDVKTSLMRASPSVLKYNLVVRPAEKHASRVYALALIPEALDQVHLVGWATTEELPTEVAQSGPFFGAYVVSAQSLNAFAPIRHKFD